MGHKHASYLSMFRMHEYILARAIIYVPENSTSNTTIYSHNITITHRDIYTPQKKESGA